MNKQKLATKMDVEPVPPPADANAHPGRRIRAREKTSTSLQEEFEALAAGLGFGFEFKASAAWKIGEHFGLLAPRNDYCLDRDFRVISTEIERLALSSGQISVRNWLASTSSNHTYRLGLALAQYGSGDLDNLAAFLHDKHSLHEGAWSTVAAFKVRLARQLRGNPPSQGPTC